MAMSAAQLPIPLTACPARSKRKRGDRNKRTGGGYGGLPRRDGRKDVPLNAPPQVPGGRGSLQPVNVASIGPDGKSGPESGGVLQDTWWQRQIPLGQGTTYTIDVKAGDETGRTV